MVTVAAGDDMVAAADLALAGLGDADQPDFAAPAPEDTPLSLAPAPSAATAPSGATGADGPAATTTTAAATAGSDGASTAIGAAPDILIDSSSDPGAARGPPLDGATTRPPRA